MGVEAALISIAVVSTAAGIVESKRAADKQDDIRDEQKKQASAEHIRAKRKQIREARIRAATAENAAAQTGSLDSSSVVQNQGSIQSQLGSNLGFLDRSNARSNKIFSLQEDIASSQFKAGIFDTIGNKASTVAVARASRPKAPKKVK